MDNNRLILAAAGSGKTSFLINEALREKNENVVIVTYTVENEEEIRRRFTEVNGCLPGNVTVQTWFSFLLQHGVRPYQRYLFDKDIKGLVFVNGQSAIKYTGKFWQVFYSEVDEFERHYFSEDTKIFTDKLSKFVCRCNDVGKGAVIDRLSRIYPHIFIDEVQDLSGYDLAFISFLFESSSRILLVWDPRQTTYSTHDERKFGKYKGGRIKDFIIKECKKGICVIDEMALNKSYRNNEIICRVSSRLYPDFAMAESGQKSKTGHDWVFLVKPEDVKEYIQRYDPDVLRWDKRVKVEEGCRVMNFWASKGLWFDRVLIYPTEAFLQYFKDWKLKKVVKWRTTNAFDIAKLYVALTRARFSVAIVCDYTNEAYINDVTKFDLSMS